MNRALIGLLIATLLLGGTFFAGYRHKAQACLAEAQAEKLAAVSRAIEQADALHEQDNAVAVVAETRREQRQARAIKLDAAIDRYFSNPSANPLPSPLPRAGEGALKESHATPVNPVCGLDANGLRLWNIANSGADIAGPGVLDAGVPRLAPGPERRLGDAHQEPQIGDGLLPRLQGSEQREGRAAPQPRETGGAQ